LPEIFFPKPTGCRSVRLSLIPLIFLCLALSGLAAAETPGKLVSFQGPAKLTFQELLHLAVDETPPSADAEHLRSLLGEPFISNEATLSGVRPIRPAIAGLGPVLRIAEWNIARGVHQAQVEMSLSPSGDVAQIARESGRYDPAHLDRLREDLSVIRDADVVILDEVDLGMNRTGYRDVARDLARELHFNYVYGVEFIELDRLYLGQKHLDEVGQRRPHSESEVFGVEPDKYLGLEGSAVLSRYPIQSARIVRLPQCYDWFHGEIQQISDLELVRRWSAEKIFEERVRRQVRRGGRMSLIVKLQVPEALGGQVTIVTPHLENYCPPSCRETQLKYLLDQIGESPNTVILGGDLNTSGHDGTPTSVRHEILKRVLDYRFWVKEAIVWLLPVPFAGAIEYPINYLKNYHDPTALDLHFVAPNKEKPLFNDARAFQFTDGGGFDFAGSSGKTTGHKGRTLAQSNEREWKGFAPTFFFRRTYFHLVGSYKLDWFFVKPDLKAATGAPLNPYYGRTLKDLNTALEKRTSDHCPITIDLPLRGESPAVSISAEQAGSH
jgi:endonuclease/exonuclease/phosphatase family metal-dependent hydrolase